MRVLGVDPGSRRTGYGVVERAGSEVRRVASGVILASGPLCERLAAIHRDLLGVIESTRPDAAALEAVFSARNARSALVLGQARGVALAACGSAGLPTAEYAPSAVKLAVTGYGRADKAQVQRMVERLVGRRFSPSEDEADAIAVAICHGHHQPPNARPLEATR